MYERSEKKACKYSAHPRRPRVYRPIIAIKILIARIIAVDKMIQLLSNTSTTMENNILRIAIIFPSLERPSKK